MLDPTHPTDEAIQAFALGKLGSGEYPPVEAHLAGCDVCQERAERVAPDTLVSLLASARTRFDSVRTDATTPTFAASATPSYGHTHAWADHASEAGGDADIPPVLAGHPRYRVLRRLGAGGMGTVWLAEHTVMNRPVAVKVIRPELLSRSGATTRFLREVRAAAKLHHPNIVTAFDAEAVGDSCLLVMEYVPGETLADCVKAGPLPTEEACRAIRDAAGGLAHAHAAGLVHRDVKPHNLIRAADGTVKVLDFGLAGVGADVGPAVPAGTVAGEGLTGAGMVVGTPDYIAPEQVSDPHAADARADIYGLGCTLYHLLAGRPPFPEGNIAEKLAAHETRTPDPIPDLAADLAAILAKMLAKRPQDRYQSADEVVAALEHICEASRSRDAAAERGRGSRRWIAVAAGLLFAGLLVAAGVVFKVYRDNQEITITTDDPDIEVVMKRKGELVRIRDAKTGQEWELNTLTNEIGLVDQPGGLTVNLPEKEPFILRRRGEKVFTIARMAKPDVPRAEDPSAEQGTSLVRLPTGKENVLSVAFFADGRVLVCGDRNGIARVWNPATGKQVRQFEGHTDWIGAGAITPDGKQVVTGCADKVVRVFDASTEEQIHRLTGHTSYVNRVAVSRDSRSALTASALSASELPDKRVLYWDLRAGQLIRPLVGHTGSVSSVAFSPDGLRAATGSADETVRVWDLATGNEMWQKASRGAAQVRFTPEGQLLWADDVAVRICDPTTGEEVRRVTDTGANVSVDLSPDGRRLLVTASSINGNWIRVWDVRSGRLLHKIEGGSDPLVTACLSRDGRRVAAGTFRQGTLVWRLPDPPAAKPDKELLRGSWKAISGEAFGLPVPQQLVDLMQPTLTAAPDKLTLKLNLDKMPVSVDALTKLLKGFGEKDKAGSKALTLSQRELAAVLDKQGVEAVYTLDPTKTPKAITISYLSPIKRTLLGIYSLEGDTLRICVTVDPDRAEERPTKFATEAGQAYAVFKRMSGAELPTSPKGTFKKPDGTPLALTLDGQGKFTVTRNGQLSIEGSYTITGNQIEFTDEAGPDRSQGAEQTGTYTWRLAGWSLLFERVKDQARGRRDVLEPGAWMKTPESIAPKNP